jgi:2-haloacid dehalogenase
VSSNGWDVAGAKAFGLRVAWVNRQGAPLDELGVTPDLEVRDLGQLAQALGR